MWSLKKQNLGTIGTKTDAKSLKKNEDQSILRIFENSNIKHYKDMNSRKTNWKLIENITVEVPNTQSISKNILFHVSKFPCLRLFWFCRVSVVKFSYWSKFNFNIITSSGVMTIFIYKGLTRNPEIGTTPVWVLANIWRMGQVRDTKLVINVSNEKLKNAVKCKGYSFYWFWDIIRGKDLD